MLYIALKNEGAAYEAAGVAQKTIHTHKQEALDKDNKETSLTLDNTLIYYCRKCGNREENIGESTVVLSNQIRRKEKSIHHIINKYTKEDVTLPRIRNIPCPNPDCSSLKTGQNGGEGSAVDRGEISQSGARENEVIYYRYDDDNLKYLYICAVCDNVWETQS